MTDNVQSMMLEILKRIQADMSGLKTDVAGLKTDVADIKARVERMEPRVERLDELVKRQRRDSAASLVMMRGTAGEIDERLREVEIDVRLVLERDPLAL